MGTAQSFVGAPLAERIGRVVKAERPIRLDEATLRVREAAGVAHSSARTRKQMRLGGGRLCSEASESRRPRLSPAIRSGSRQGSTPGRRPCRVRSAIRGRIASEELGAAPAHFLRAGYGIEPRDAAHEARRQFGLKQAGRKIVERFRRVLDQNGVREGFLPQVRSAADRLSPLRHRRPGGLVTASPLRPSNHGRPAMQQSSPFSECTERIVLVIIGADLLLQAAETVPAPAGSAKVFHWAGAGTWLVFTIEWCLRIRRADDWRKYLFTFLGVTDTLAILPLWLFAGFDLKALRAFRLFRLFRSTTRLAGRSRAVAKVTRAFAVAKDGAGVVLAGTGVMILTAGLGCTTWSTTPSQQSSPRDSTVCGGRSSP